MTSNLPDVRSTELASLGGQAALFEQPAQLLDLDDVALKELAILFGRHGASVFAQVRAQAGLLAWAGWFRFGEVTYAAFLLGLAKDLGVEPDTLTKWRRDAVKTRKLAVPGMVKARSDAAKEGRKTAGQPGGAGRSSGKSAPIPTTSTEAPANPSEGVGKNGTGSPSHSAPGGTADRPGSPNGAPSDPSSGGAGIQRPQPPTGALLAPLSAPPDASKNDTGPVPSLRQEASAAFRALHDAAEGIGAKWTVEEATYWQNRTQREMDAWRKANRINQPKPPRRQGTVSRPADRVPAMTNGAGSLSRRDVEPMFKKS